MRKNLALITLLFFLMACQTPRPAQEFRAPHITGAIIVETTQPKTTKEEEPVQPRPQNTSLAEEKPGVVEQLLHSIRTNITSYSFFVGKTQVFVLENKMRVLFGDFVELPFETNNSRTFLTDAYINLSSRTAVGYCDVRREERILGSFNADRSKCLKLANIPINVSFEQVYAKTPVDWLEEYQHSKPTIIETTDQYLKQPTGWFTINPVIHYEFTDKTVIMRIDKKTRMPVRIEIVEDDKVKKVEYEWLLVNQVKKEDVEYQPFPR